MERIKVKIKPNSSENKIVEKGSVWKINIKAPAQENKANLELLKFLKKELKKNVQFVSGLKSKEKVLEIF
ncbi:DUF167 domain-containing protein [Candidatus Woesearchaeota archaeon]|nr:DUF167 domain-containing protein [Candidatus Woesearchaeota archaeon]